MTTSRHNGTAVVGTTKFRHNGTAPVPVTKSRHNGTAVVTSYSAGTDGPTPVAASTATADNGTTAITTISAPMPAGLAVGNHVLIAVRARLANTTFSAPGFTAFMVPHTAGGQSTGFLVRSLTTSADVTAVGSAVTVSLSVAATAVCRTVRITGSRGVDVSTGNDSGSATSLATASITTSGPNRLVIGIHGMSVADRTPTLPATMTVIGAMVATAANFNATHDALNLGSEAVAAAGPIGTRTFAISGLAAAQAVQVVAFAPVLV